MSTLVKDWFFYIKYSAHHYRADCMFALRVDTSISARVYVRQNVRAVRQIPNSFVQKVICGEQIESSSSFHLRKLF